jgi:hypothetical protein
LDVGRLIQVTRGDPFANCTADNAAGQEASFGSTLFPNTSIEPFIAVDPTDFEKVLVGHQQDRWSDGGARGTIGVLSRVDDLDAWHNTIPPGVTQCTGGSFVRSSDPWVTYSNDGTAFFLHLTTDPAPGTPFASSRTGMLISRSTDHGRSWQSPTTLIDETTTQALNDKDSVTADWTRTGNVYAVWDRLSLVTTPGVAAAAALPQLGSEGVVIARKRIQQKRFRAAEAAAAAQTVTSFGPTLLSRTTNNGDTWSKPAIIYDPGPNNQTINNIVQVTPDGAVYDFFTSIIGAAPTIAIGFVKSTDKGVTFGGPVTAQVISGNSVVSPDSGQAVRDAGILASVAVNKRTGALYIAWQDIITTATCTTPGAGTIPVDSIVFSQSLDGGLTWSAPIQVNQTPTNANGCRQQAFIPAIAVANDGRHLVVTYYDFRNDTNTPVGNEGTDYFAVECDVGSDCSKAKSWGGEVRMTNASFNILDAPFAEGRFLGDYMSLAPLESRSFVPIFGIATGPNLTADFTRRIRTEEFEDSSR